VLLRHGLAIPRLRYFDTLALSRRTWPWLKSHALGRLANTFNIHYNAHNALDDARVCGRIILLAAGKKDKKNIAELLASAGLKTQQL
jgi:DNA polymerase-3 subunit epsilon